MRINGLGLITNEGEGFEVRQINYSYFFKEEEMSFSPQVGWKKYIVHDKSKTASVKKIILSKDNSYLEIYLEGPQMLPNEHWMLTENNWKPCKAFEP